MRQKRSVEELLWETVTKSPEPDGCWTRVGNRGYSTPSGYTYLYKDGVRDYAHRVSYRLYVGPLLDDELVRHTCDCPPCIRPDHLLKGTDLDNSNDKVSRDRQSKGESQPAAKLTEEKVIKMRELHATGILQKDLAKQFGVSTGIVSEVIRRIRWKHVA